MSGEVQSARGGHLGPKQGYFRNVARVFAPELACYKLGTQRY